MTDTALLSVAYWAPIQYYCKLLTYGHCFVEQYDNYAKQSYRNRCLIAVPEGKLALTVPVDKGEEAKCLVKDVRLSDHGNWRHLHWNALESAYRNSPFFEYYADDFRPFYERKWTFLVDFNEAIAQTVCELIGLKPIEGRTDEYSHADKELRIEGRNNAPIALFDDWRDTIHPKHPYDTDAHFQPAEYYQVFSDRNGFLPNLSIADLLFNMGPESILVLQQSAGQR